MALLNRIARLEAVLQQAPSERAPPRAPVARRAARGRGPRACARHPAGRPARRRRRACSRRAPPAPAPPAAVPEPIAPPAPPARTDVTLDEVIGIWPAALETIGTDFSLLAAALSNARPVELEDGALVVAFAPDDTFNRRMAAESADHRRALGEALQALTGARLRLGFELRDLGEQVDPAGPGGGRARRAHRAGVRRAGDRPRRQSRRRSRSPPASRCPTPTTKVRPDAPAEHAADAQAGPEDAGGHDGRPGEAQGRGARGVRRRRDGHGQDLRATWS